MEDTPTAFGALLRSIAHQQISIFAGRAIVGRLVAACGGEIEPERVLGLTETDLKGIGLSQQKVRYVQALAAAVAGGLLTDLESLAEEMIAERLIHLPGIGIWTVQMFCLFHLQRPDVFSGGDLGLREGIRILDERAESPTPSEAERRAEIWSPYRSVAAVVLWDLVRQTRLAQGSK
ncbi:MAG TPA: DNA-3-methyladenine glycosylase 2 family protein [Chloroflexota bacterium]